MGACNAKKLERNKIRTYYVGEQRCMTTLGNKGRMLTVLGYDDKKRAVFCAREGKSSRWYKLSRNERWGGVRPNPIKNLQDHYQIAPGVPLKAGETQKQHYWKAQNRWKEERAQDESGHIPLRILKMTPCNGNSPTLRILKMTPCNGNSPSPSRGSDDESW